LLILALLLALTPKQRSTRARIAALIRWSQEDPTANAERGQAGLRARFEREVDPDNTLSPAERARRTDAAYRAHMARLSFNRSRRAKIGDDVA
jgi:hypothetical protein